MTLPNLFRPEDVERAARVDCFGLGCPCKDCTAAGTCCQHIEADQLGGVRRTLNAGLPPALRALAEAAIEAHANRNSSGGIPSVFRREVWLAVENFARSLKGEAT